jgi:hypothetical protein
MCPTATINNAGDLTGTIIPGGPPRRQPQLQAQAQAPGGCLALGYCGSVSRSEIVSSIAQAQL